MRTTNLAAAVLCFGAAIGPCLAVGATAAPAPLQQLENAGAADHAADPSTGTVQTTVEKDTTSELSGGLRLDSIRTEGMRDGMQAGLAWRYDQIEDLLRSQSLRLHQVFDFSKVMVNPYVLPPVITVVHDMLRQDDDDTARLTRVGYRIEYPARIVTEPPQWTDFLIKDFKPPQQPSSVILPRTDKERSIWKAAVEEGWKKGVQQANNVYSGSLALLTRTYKGMIEYHILRKEGVVSEPLTARTDLGVVIDGREMNVGDTIFRLTRHSGFEGDGHWKPALRENSDTDVSVTGND